MQRVNAQEMLDLARRIHEGADGHEKDLVTAENIYHQILNHNVGAIIPLYCLGSLYMEVGKYGLAIQILSYVTSVSPEFGEAWNNLGLAWRGVLNPEKADECFAKAEEYLKVSPQAAADTSCNRGAMRVNAGKPEECLEFCEKSLKLIPGHPKSRWHKALALLEMQRWSEAWQWHEYRLTPGSANSNIEERNYHAPDMTPWWDGKSPGTVVIHGEQGLGDEIMFASCIEDMRREGVDFIIEPSPRMHNLFKRSFPDFVNGTNDTDGRDWIERKGKPDYKIAIGSLPKFCRLKDEDFPGTPYLIPSRIKAAKYRRKLNRLGDKAKIGITWQGGVESTAQHLRSVFPETLEPILRKDATFISLQYTKDAQANLDRLKEETGINVIHWPEAAHAEDMDEPVALMSELDLIISVCQTAVHIGGALGVPTLCLTPSAPSWRYGVTGNMPWYASVDLIRQEGDDWTPAVEECARRVDALIEQRKAA